MINVLCGAPGSGKTTYVLEKKRRGDALIDLDLLFQAVTGLPIYDKPPALVGFVNELKHAAIDRAVFSHTTRMIADVWIITGGAKVADRYGIANRCRADHVYILSTPAAECIRRISLDDRRNTKLWYWRKLIIEWRREFEPHPRDEYLPTP